MIEVFDPTSGPVFKSGMSPRLKTLDGKRFGVIWNSREFGDRLLKKILEILGRKYKFELVQFLKKPFVGNVAPAEFFERLVQARVDAAIVGPGD